MSDKDKAGKPATRLAQGLGWVEPRYGGVVLPVHMATTYERDADGGYERGRVYGRDHNPNVEQAETLLTSLEGGANALLFSSGMAAATAVFLALKPGDHVIAPKVMYWALRNWLQKDAVAWGLEVSFIDMDKIGDVAATLQPGKTKLVWLETPANPTWVISDIAAIAEIAHKAGARVAVDSTVATPLLTRPLALGADIVMHAATKYLNGHSDVIAGALIGAQDNNFWQTIAGIRKGYGAILGPMEAWLLLRGMRTLHLRVLKACENAQHIAETMAEHPKILLVLYPGLPSHPGHAIARRQMQGGFGGMLSLRLRDGEAAAMNCAARLKLFKRATSLGGVESLVEHRASIEGPGSPAPVDMLRLSIGIEDCADLIADLEQALT